MIVIGLYYKNICYINELIPIWMIVFGAVGAFIIILRLFSNIYSKCRLNFRYFLLFSLKICFFFINFRSKNKSLPKPFHYFTVFVALFLFAWFICGILNY
jgi:hypothetical protein